MSRRLVLAAVFACTLPLAPAAAAEGGDARAGAELAERVCSRCHVVGPQGRAGTDAAPSFAAIAERRSADYVRGFLANPHGGALMPPAELAAREIEDIVAYLRLR